MSLFISDDLHSPIQTHYPAIFTTIEENRLKQPVRGVLFVWTFNEEAREGRNHLCHYLHLYDGTFVMIKMIPSQRGPGKDRGLEKDRGMLVIEDRKDDPTPPYVKSSVTFHGFEVVRKVGSPTHEPSATMYAKEDGTPTVQQLIRSLTGNKMHAYKFEKNERGERHWHIAAMGRYMEEGLVTLDQVRNLCSHAVNVYQEPTKVLKRENIVAGVFPAGFGELVEERTLKKLGVRYSRTEWRKTGAGHPPRLEYGQPPSQHGGQPQFGQGSSGGYGQQLPPGQYGGPPSQHGSYGQRPWEQGSYPQQQGGGYPGQQQGASGQRPPQQGGYPQQQGAGYPGQQQGASGQRPPQQGGYPQQQGGGYPGQQQGASGQRPPQQGGYPQQQGGGYPGQQQGASGQRRLQQGSHPPQQGGGYSGQQQHGGGAPSSRRY